MATWQKTHTGEKTSNKLNIMRTMLRCSLALIVISTGIAAVAGDLKITIPKRTKPTPVQQLNREGVKAVEKHQLEKAAQLFYRAYLIDPDDPFTLNNLGYISELQGNIQRAVKCYELAATQKTETVIADSTSPNLDGRPLSAATNFTQDTKLRVNRGNLEAMSLLEEGRIPEAEGVLLHTLALDKQNPFTLNNLGYTMEAEGNPEAALRYYNQAADLHSSQSIVAAADPRWRGKAISEVAADNARALAKSMEQGQTPQVKAARLNAEGVFALNHNDPQQARNDFYQAYKLDPYSSFSLNNMGYVAEMNGDQETADDFYDAAQRAPGAVQPAAVTSHVEMKGQPLAKIAAINDQYTEITLQTEQEAKRRQGGPIQLKRRDGTLVPEPQTPAQPNPQ
jgi:Flp pilus assembly protein TadD